MMGNRKAISGQQKGYKRGQGSLGPTSSGTGLRPGTAQKRPASPNTNLTKNLGGNGTSPYALGLGQPHHNNLMSGSMSGQHGFSNQVLMK